MCRTRALYASCSSEDRKSCVYGTARGCKDGFYVELCFNCSCTRQMFRAITSCFLPLTRPLSV